MQIRTRYAKCPFKEPFVQTTLKNSAAFECTQNNKLSEIAYMQPKSGKGGEKEPSSILLSMAQSNTKQEGDKLGCVQTGSRRVDGLKL